MRAVLDAGDLIGLRVDVYPYGELRRVLALLDADLVGRSEGIAQRIGWLNARREELLLRG